MNSNSKLKILFYGPLFAVLYVICFGLNANSALADTIEWESITWEYRSGTAVSIDPSGNLLIAADTYEYTSSVWVDLASSTFNYIEVTAITPSTGYGPGIVSEYRYLSDTDYAYLQVPFVGTNRWRVGTQINGVTEQTRVDRGDDDANQTHTLGIGRRSSGIVDFYLDQILVYSSTGSQTFEEEFNYLFLIGGDIGENVTYTDLTLSSDYQGPDDSSTVPEPGTLLLFASGLGLAWSRIMREKHA